MSLLLLFFFFFFQAEDGIRDIGVTGVQTCALPICEARRTQRLHAPGARHPAVRRGGVRRAARGRHHDHAGALEDPRGREDPRASRRYHRGTVLMKARGLGIVTAEGAPKAIGPYSQAVVVDGMVYTAGQIPLDPRTGDIVGKNTAEQTEQTLRNLAAVLQGAGSSLDLVVKTTVYLVDMADFPAMNEVYAKHFSTHKPARSTVQAAALPKAVRVEIDAIARVG